jgi:hypothetical protein
MVVGCLLGVIMYYGIIRQNAEKGEGSSQGFLIGYGMVIPISLWLPFQLVDLLDIRSVGFRLGGASMPMTITLRCLEAMHGFAPPTSRQSPWEYAVSVGLILRPMYDENRRTIPLTREIFLDKLHRHGVWLVIFAVLFHATYPSGFYPFPTSVKANEVLLSFELGHLYNTFVQAGKYLLSVCMLILFV